MFENGFPYISEFREINHEIIEKYNGLYTVEIDWNTAPKYIIDMLKTN